MENSESITGASAGENPNVLQKDDEKLHQAEETKAGETEAAPLKDKNRTTKKDDRKEDTEKSSQNQTNKEQYSEKTLKELQSQFIVPADKLKDSRRSSDTSFYCELCEAKLVNLAKCQSHARTRGHKKAAKTRGEFLMLSRVDPPSQHQSLALSKLLDSVFLKHGLCPVKDLPTRQKVAEDFGKTVTAKFPECSISMYGSSFTGFGLKQSDVNLDLVIPDEVNIPHVLLSILDLLQKDEHYCDVKSEFDAKVPRILFKHISSGLVCEISPGNIKATKTSLLLKKYSDFDHRVRTLVIALRYWARICNIDCQSEGGLPGYSLALMVIQFLQETKPPVLPRWVPSETIEEDSTDASDTFVINNTESTGSLWFQLFRFYCVDFDIPNWVISIKEPVPLTREKKKWSCRRIAVEDPFSSKRNVACSLSSDKAFDYFFTCWKNSFLYFSSVPNNPQNGPIADVQNLRPNWLVPKKNDNETGNVKKQEAKVQAEDEAIFQMDDLDSTTKQVESLNLSSSDSKDGGASQRQTDKDATILKSKDQIDAEKEGEIILSGSYSENGTDSRATETTSSEVECRKTSDASLQSVAYKFDAQVFRGNKRPVKTCCFCKEDGHVKEQCPDLKKPLLCRLPPMSARFAAVLDYVCKKCRADFEFEKTEVSYREKVLQNLEDYIHQIFPDARLFLFGSSKNGFGFRNSDIDICMTLENQAKEDVDSVDVIIELSKLLKKHKDCGNVLAITTAKVPIVKFYLRSCKREADISLYNTLALENTRMLATYAKLDDRVATLGYTVKVFAKVCDIGDASKGSLSSYAYILMLLHYLQQCNPPVIPVLQTLYTDKKPPEKIVDGWNCWFLSDLKKIKSIWNQKEKNTLSAGLLWYGFLRYYTEEFDFEHDVVCCRRTKKLTKFEKMWTKHVFAIEDPFNLDHNLGAGVTRKMANYILTAFIRGRERFGLPRYDIPQELSQRYFFDVYYLTDGYEAPTDRNCRVCGKIGHIAKDCPHSKANKRAEQRKEEEERRLRREAGEKSDMGQKPFSARPRSVSAPNKPGQNKNADGSQPLTAGLPRAIPSRQDANVSSGTNLSKSQPDSQAVASPSKGMQSSKPGKDMENTGETAQSKISQMQSPVQNRQTDSSRENEAFGGQKTVPDSRNVPVNSGGIGNDNNPFTTEAIQPSTLIKIPQSLEQLSQPGTVIPPGLCAPDGMGQIPHVASQGSPIRATGSMAQSPPVNMSPASLFQGQPIVMGTPPRRNHATGSKTQSPPVNVSAAGIFQGQPIVMGTPPRHHQTGMFSPQGSPFVGSPIQHELWLRQQGGIMPNPHSPPMRPLVPYPMSPEILSQQQWRGDSESMLTDHLGSPVRGHLRLTEHSQHMLPQSPPSISRTVMWPLAPGGPHHNLANFQDPAIVSKQQFSRPAHPPGFLQGSSPTVPPQQTQFPPGTPGTSSHVAVGSPQPMPQLPPQGAMAQPPIGTHMTGEQFINFMRAVEEESKKVEAPPTNLPSNNEFEAKELHIASKNLKVAKTPEEHKLLSKLNKVKSLWEGNSTTGLQNSCPISETISEVDLIEHVNLLEQSDMGYTDLDTKIPERKEAWVGVAEKEIVLDHVNAVQLDQEKRDGCSDEAQDKTSLLKDENRILPSEQQICYADGTQELPEVPSKTVIKEERSMSGNAKASDEKQEAHPIKNEHMQKSKQQQSSDAAAPSPPEEVAKQKPSRRGGRGRKPKSPKQSETVNSTPEKQEKPLSGKQSKAKNSPARSHNPKSYDDVKSDPVKASPKKPKAERSEEKIWDTQSGNRGGGGAGATPRQSPKNKESPKNEKDRNETKRPEVNKQEHSKNPRTGNPPNSPGDSSKGGASNRGYRRPRSRTSKGGPGEEKQDSRNRSNSTPEKRQPKDS